MRYSENWESYKLIDTSSGLRLEKWGDIVLIRPDPQVIWKTEKTDPLWRKAHAEYIRSNTGGGKWNILKKIPSSWQIKYEDLTFNVKNMGFKHTGIFPEQAVNWDLTRSIISGSKRNDIKVLNLFAYTGGATVACLKEDASVVHVDASKGMVSWAKENAVSSSLADRPVRWIVDDCEKFVQREIRRGNKYDIIIMDPPSYGRGPGGEVWKIEDKVYSLIEQCSLLLSDSPLLFMINSYTTGLSPSVMKYMLDTLVASKIGGEVYCDEIGIPVSDSRLVLPCGSTAFWVNKQSL